METYNGVVRTPADAIILFEACRLGLLPRVQRRLSEKERQSIRSGSVFVWDEREAGMRRWTDGKSWSASRVSGSFLTYREMEGKRGGSGLSSNNRTPEQGRASADLDSEEGPDGYRYKPDGLMKQSFSITTSTGQHLHLISYYSRNPPTQPNLQQPTQDHTLRHIRPQKGMYPESTINDQSNVPAVTRSPMVGAPPYAHHMSPPPGYPRHAAHPHGYLPPGYAHPAYTGYPPSPMSTPPAHWPMHYAPGMPPMPGPLPHGMAYPPHLQGHPPPHHYMAPRPGEQSAPPMLSHPPASSPPSQAPPAYAPAAPSPISAPPSNDGKSPRTQSGLQIDPRLIGVEAPQISPGAKTIQHAEANQEPKSFPPVSESHYIPVTASEIPSIGNLVNGAAAAAAVIAKAEADAKAARKDAEERRSASRSPGGTKKGPKDIPSEKLGFGEDKRALRQLDKVFIP